MNALDALIEHWRAYDPSGAHQLHRRDIPFFETRTLTVHSGIHPYPYVGDLRAADVWLLMLNSKLGANDAAEEGTEPYSSLFRKNLLQELEEEQFPLLSLNPALRHTGTYRYYNHERGLAAVVGKLAEKCGLPEIEARRICSQRIAILELLPYRSESFSRELRTLPSVNLARRAAHEAAESKLLIVPWGIESWGLRARDNVLHKPARSFTFAPHGTAGYGQAIVERLARRVI